MVGTAGRMVLIELLPDATGTMHWATFVANVLGAFMLGWFVARGRTMTQRSDLVVPFFAIGLFGSLTTFSALMIDMVEAATNGDAVAALAYGATSIAVGLLAAAVGMRLARADR